MVRSVSLEETIGFVGYVLIKLPYPVDILGLVTAVLTIYGSSFYTIIGILVRDALLYVDCALEALLYLDPAREVCGSCLLEEFSR